MGWFLLCSYSGHHIQPKCKCLIPQCRANIHDLDILVSWWQSVWCSDNQLSEYILQNHRHWFNLHFAGGSGRSAILDLCLSSYFGTQLKLALIWHVHSYGNKWKHDSGLNHSITIKSLMRYSAYCVIVCWPKQVTWLNVWQRGTLCLQGGSMSHMLVSRDMYSSSREESKIWK